MPVGAAGDEDLIDAFAIHINNLKAQFLPFEVIARGRYAPELHQNKAGQRVVSGLLRQLSYVQESFERKR
jgi:hypothetical protein